MKSKTTLKKQTRKKTHPEIVSTIKAALHQKAWFPLAATLAGPSRGYAAVNLDEIDATAKEGDTIIIPGKLLSRGTLTKKVRIVALQVSTSARAKIRASKSELVTIRDEIKSNPKAQGIRVVA